MTTSFPAWTLYLFTVAAFVGVVSGIVLALLWALRYALVESVLPVPDRYRRALLGLGLMVAGIAIGTVVVPLALAGPFMAAVYAITSLYGDYPPPLVATAGFGALLALCMVVAIVFATWWRRRVWLTAIELP